MHPNPMADSPPKPAQVVADDFMRRLMDLLSEAPPQYGHVIFTYLAGKITKIEKQESFKV